MNKLATEFLYNLKEHLHQRRIKGERGVRIPPHFLKHGPRDFPRVVVKLLGMFTIANVSEIVEENISKWEFPFTCESLKGVVYKDFLQLCPLSLTPEFFSNLN